MPDPRSQGQKFIKKALRLIHTKFKTINNPTPQPQSPAQPFDTEIWEAIRSSGIEQPVQMSLDQTKPMPVPELAAVFGGWTSSSSALISLSLFQDRSISLAASTQTLGSH